MSTKRAVYEIADFKAMPADDGEEKGRFEAIVSVFGNVDAIGDRVVEGAFAKSIERWRASGAPIPILWSHDWGNPHAHIGSADPAEVAEVPGKGLLVPGTIDLDNPFAAQVYRLMSQRRVKEFSFGYEVKREKRAKDGANELLELDIIEAGPTLKGMNPATELVAIKSALEDAAIAEGLTDGTLPDGEPDEVATKAGRRISRATEAELSSAADEAEALARRIRSLLSQGDSEDEKTSDDAEEVKVQADEPKALPDLELLELNALIMKASS
jgi:HK97 family phage prohead protease